MGGNFTPPVGDFISKSLWSNLWHPNRKEGNLYFLSCRLCCYVVGGLQIEEFDFGKALLDWGCREYDQAAHEWVHNKLIHACPQIQPLLCLHQQIETGLLALQSSGSLNYCCSICDVSTHTCCAYGSVEVVWHQFCKHPGLIWDTFMLHYQPISKGPTSKSVNCESTALGIDIQAAFICWWVLVISWERSTSSFLKTGKTAWHNYNNNNNN